MTAAKKAEAKQPEEVKEEEQKQEETVAEEVKPVPPKPQPKKYKLKNSQTQYAEGSFTLAGKQEKELPKNPSAELLKRIKAGFIIEVK